MLVGHEHIIQDLEKLSREKRLSHGYIFFGPSEVGKYTIAKGLARYLETGEWRDNTEETPRILLDAFLVEPDEQGSIGIDAARSVRDFLWQKPVLSAYRTLIVNDAESLTSEAQNALLRVTEEPPPSGLLILVLKEPEMLWPTVVSRFQKLYFGPVPEDEVAEWLKEHKGASAKEAKEIARRAFGRPGLAAYLLEGDAFGGYDKEVHTFLRDSSSSQKTFIKELVGNESFDLKKFLDSLIFTISEQGVEDRKFWHTVVALRRTVDFVNVNPRIQLTHLWNLHRASSKQSSTRSSGR